MQGKSDCPYTSDASLLYLCFLDRLEVYSEHNTTTTVNGVVNYNFSIPTSQSGYQYLYGNDINTNYLALRITGYLCSVLRADYFRGNAFIVIRSPEWSLNSISWLSLCDPDSSTWLLDELLERAHTESQLLKHVCTSTLAFKSFHITCLPIHVQEGSKFSLPPNE